MKLFVYLLALLAALKLGHQEFLFRASTREAIVKAYKDRAIQACQKDAKNVGLGITPQAWANPTSIDLVIGRSNLEVRLWQLDHEMWNARFRNPYLWLSAASRSGSIYCEYDIVHAAAAVHRL